MLKTSSGQTAFAGLEKRLTGSAPDDAPSSVRRSVRLMLCGGAATAVLGAFLVIALIADKNALTDASGKKVTGGELTSGVVSYAILYVALATVWVLMARMNLAGRGWARIAASVLAGISTINAYSTVNSLKGGQTLTVIDIVLVAGTVILWIIGAVSAVMLWRAESSAYFKARAAAR